MALAALELRQAHAAQHDQRPRLLRSSAAARFRDDKAGGHGMVDLYKSIVVSCDTYYYVLANDLGIDAIRGFMEQFGFGSRTGIDLERRSRRRAALAGMEDEALPPPEQQKWYAGETISIGIGQGYNAYTPLQLAQRDGDARQRRRDVPPAPRRATSRTRARGERSADRARARAQTLASKPRAPRRSSSAPWSA